MTLGLGDRVQTLDDPTLVVIGSFERTIGDETELIEALLEGFSNDVVYGVKVRRGEGGRRYGGAYCTRT